MMPNDHRHVWRVLEPKGGNYRLVQVLFLCMTDTTWIFSFFFFSQQKKMSGTYIVCTGAMNIENTLHKRHGDDKCQPIDNTSKVFDVTKNQNYTRQEELMHRFAKIKI